MELIIVLHIDENALNALSSMASKFLDTLTHDWTTPGHHTNFGVRALVIVVVRPYLAVIGATRNDFLLAFDSEKKTYYFIIIFILNLHQMFFGETMEIHDDVTM